MCGIAGLWQVRGGVQGGLEAAARAMADALVHRGPDSGDVWVDPERGLALAHRRLAIIDLSPAGNQPMVSPSGRYVIVFNGEIYNHVELRADLQRDGKAPPWNGHSDTETLLACMEAWGFVLTLSRLVGMFGFALWDRQSGILRLARDRMGEKPLYYGWADKTFLFGSELKALLAYPRFDTTIDREALGRYMRHGYVPAPHSIYRDARKLPPGTWLSVSAEGWDQRPEPVAYWSVIDAAKAGLANPIADPVEALEAVKYTLTRAVTSQMIADVPLGAFLSGGIDSSLVAALMQAHSSKPVRTITATFGEKGYNEAPFAAAVANHLGTDHTDLRVSSADALNLVPKLPRLYDEPFADSSQIATHLICVAAREHVTVVLSGDAGDEVFGGYNRYIQIPRIWNYARKLSPPLRRAFASSLQSVSRAQWGRLARLVPAASRPLEMAHKVGDIIRGASDIESAYRGAVTCWPDDDGVVLAGKTTATPLPDLAPQHCAGPEESMMLWDMVTYLPDDILVKVDRAAMGASLETRAPFLDHRLIELGWRLPVTMKVRGSEGKWILRQILDQYVPRPLIDRPKTGFAVPLGDWLCGPLRDWAEALLDYDRLEQQGYLSATQIRRRWREHLTGRRDWTFKIWTVLMFQAWLEGGASTGASAMPRPPARG
jgi:asparagine synthase (glutamine-hydrolysing)